MTPNFILSIITGEAAAAAKRARRSAIEYIVAGAAALVGLAFLLLAAYIYTARIYDGLTAAIAFGAVFLAVGVGVLVYHRISARARARRARKRMSSEAVTLAATLGIAVLPALLSKKGLLAGIALPVLSAIAYSIYRENAGSDEDDEG